MGKFSLLFLALLFLFIVALRFVLRRDQYNMLLISVTLSFIFAEVVCRWMDIGNPHVLMWHEDEAVGMADNYHYQPFGKLIYRYPDNPRGYFDTNNSVVGHINSQGFRGTAVSRNKPKDKKRIIFLGDSFTLGFGVKDEDTLPVNVEKMLNAQLPFDVEVLNFGVTNTATGDQVRLLENYALAFHPDVVIIVIFLNDAKWGGTIEFMSRAQILISLRQYSYFLNAMIGSVEGLIMHRKMIQHYLQGYEENSPGWQSIQTALEKGKALGKRRHFELLVTVYPVLYHLDQRYPFQKIHQKIARFCQNESIRFFDFLQGFNGIRDKDLWVHRTDQHPNNTAQKIAAKSLASYLLQNRLLDKQHAE